MKGWAYFTLSCWDSGMSGKTAEAEQKPARVEARRSAAENSRLSFVSSRELIPILAVT